VSKPDLTLRRKRSRRRVRLWLHRHIAPIVVVVLVVTSFRSAIADWNVIPSGSMNPTIIEGDRIFVNKLAFGVRVPYTMWYIAEWSHPQRGDVIVFHSPADGTRMVKRVVGLPGETVELRDNRVFINGQPAAYTLAAPPSGGMVAASEQIDVGGASHPIQLLPALPSRRDYGPVTVPTDSYFVLGDNRDNSGDSRYFGFVPRGHITGRSSHVFYSLDAEDWHAPRWNRTWSSLP
jgi:signal peptidase I